MSRPHRLFARDRETVEEAFPGDVIGLSNPGLFTIGDTVSSGEPLHFAPIPPFQPEHFGRLRNLNIAKYKQFNKGLEQLLQEAVIQVLYPLDSVRREPILAAVGVLQFDVVVARLATEYNVETTVDPLPYVAARWVVAGEEELANAVWPDQSLRLRDHAGHLVLLFGSQWQMHYAIEKNPRLQFCEVSDLVTNGVVPLPATEG
jgi:peptide chain release factor 3